LASRKPLCVKVGVGQERVEHNVPGFQMEVVVAGAPVRRQREIG